MVSDVNILTSEALFADLVRYCQADNLRCLVHEDELWVGNLRFYQGVMNNNPKASGLQSNHDQEAHVYFDARYAQIKAFASQGWRTIWYNPVSSPAPDPMPVHDGEVIGLGELSQIPVLLDKPTLSTCYGWLDAWKVPENIRRHSQLVAWMAYAMGVLLRKAGIDLDPILAHRGGLLHDLDKLQTLNSAEPHGHLSAAFLQAQGYPHLAAILREHIMGAGLQAEERHRSWEIKLVFFCDKLAEEDRIVPLNVRLQALKQRYPAFQSIMNAAEPYIWQLNDQICSILSIPGHEKLINQLVKLQNN